MTREFLTRPLVFVDSRALNYVISSVQAYKDPEILPPSLAISLNSLLELDLISYHLER